MAKMRQPSKPSASSIVRFWERIPIVVRAIVVGLFVFSILGNVAPLIFNFIPTPWSALAIIIVFWAYLRYFSGRWWPEATSELRRVRFRATKLPMRVWKWSLISALFATVVMVSGVIVRCRIIDCTAVAPAAVIDFDVLSIWQIWLTILGASAIAGISEEVGFRGYMQVPLEERYGPATGIAITSVVFIVFHLNQAWAAEVVILVILFAGAAMWGVMVVTSGSLIPAMISHIVVDIFYFSHQWKDVTGTFNNRTIGDAGVDTHFIVWLVILMASVALFAFVARKTLAARQET